MRITDDDVSSLMQITEEPFDNDNPAHREAQLRAMRYLGMEG